jgi:hypothetical protein
MRRAWSWSGHGSRGRVVGARIALSPVEAGMARQATRAARRRANFGPAAPGHGPGASSGVHSAFLVGTRLSPPQGPRRPIGMGGRSKRRQPAARYSSGAAGSRGLKAREPRAAGPAPGVLIRSGGGAAVLSRNPFRSRWAARPGRQRGLVNVRFAPKATEVLRCRKASLCVESRCGAVAVGRTYLFPPLSSGGALVVRP